MIKKYWSRSSCNARDHKRLQANVKKKLHEITGIEKKL